MFLERICVREGPIGDINKLTHVILIIFNTYNLFLSDKFSLQDHISKNVSLGAQRRAVGVTNVPRRDKSWNRDNKVFSGLCFRGGSIRNSLHHRRCSNANQPSQGAALGREYGNDRHAPLPASRPGACFGHVSIPIMSFCTENTCGKSNATESRLFVHPLLAKPGPRCKCVFWMILFFSWL